MAEDNSASGNKSGTESQHSQTSPGPTNKDDPFAGLSPEEREKAKTRVMNTFDTTNLNSIHRVTDKKILREFDAMRDGVGKASHMDMSSTNLFIIDTPHQNAKVYKDTAMISTGLLSRTDSDRQCIEAHELGHAALLKTPGHDKKVDQMAQHDVDRLKQNSYFFEAYNNMPPFQKMEQLTSAFNLAAKREEEFEADNLGAKACGKQNMIASLKREEPAEQQQLSQNPALRDSPIREFIIDHPLIQPRVNAIEHNTHSEYTLHPSGVSSSHKPADRTKPKGHSH